MHYPSTSKLINTNNSNLKSPSHLKNKLLPLSLPSTSKLKTKPLPLSISNEKDSQDLELVNNKKETLNQNMSLSANQILTQSSKYTAFPFAKTKENLPTGMILDLIFKCNIYFKKICFLYYFFFIIISEAEDIFAKNCDFFTLFFF